MSPHERLIQSLRSSLKSSSDSNPANNDSGKRTGSLFGGFYNGGFRDDPEDQQLLQQLRKMEAQYKKWGQNDRAIEMSKQIAKIRNFSQQRAANQFGSGRFPASGSSKSSPTPMAANLRAESTGVNELIRQGLSEQEALEKAVEKSKAKSDWVFGSLDPEKRSRWESIRNQILTGDLNFNDGDEMTVKLKQYLPASTSGDDHDVTGPASSVASKQTPPKERHRIVDEFGRAYGTGRRKTSIARVWLTPSEKPNEGIRMTINGRSYLEYFPRIEHRYTVFEPLLVTGTYGQFNIRTTAKGGGISGQAGAIRLGVARALQNFDPGHRPVLKEGHLLTRDSRMVERKKAGRRKARASFPYVKR